jgi:ABC-2 type transport system ATP-binding protein
MATQQTAAARLIGYLPERPPLYDTLNVSAYLKFVAKIKGVSRRQMAAELDRVVAACRLEAVFRQDIFKLSKGYRQRVGLAQALLGRPEILLLDEPTIGLDPAQMQETRDVIRAFGTNHTVMLSTHLLHEVTRICHRVAIIDQGRLLAIDSPAGLQRAVAQTHVVTLRVGMPAEQMKAAARSLQAELLAVDGVEAAQVEPATDAANQLTATCQVAARDGVEAAMARAIVPRWELHSLARQQPTLENVFLHYVGHRASTTGNAS